jgi:hypothetical protein
MWFKSTETPEEYESTVKELLAAVQRGKMLGMSNMRVKKEDCDTRLRLQGGKIMKARRIILKKREQ